MIRKSTLILFFSVAAIGLLRAQHSVARLWNERLLDGIRTDLARPTVHARNLFHTSVAMYDAWAVYSPNAEPYLLGKTVHGFSCALKPFPAPADVKAAQDEAVSFAVYRLLKHRFENSPGKENFYKEIDFLMDSLGYDKSNTSANYFCGPAEMGNYIARCVIAYGLQDGANEAGEYANLYYEPVNPPLYVAAPGNPDFVDLNRWQPLGFAQFIDQSGNVFENRIPPFVSPEWGRVLPFSLKESEANVYQRDGHDYWVYHDPGPPPYFDTTKTGGPSEEYKWNHSVVAIWSSLLDTKDGEMIDISPASIGNIQEYPTTLEKYHDFYNLFEGGDPGIGYDNNPKTGLPYVPQLVHRADYYRVLAEFWADGPNSETPPGHWFTILNYVNDQPSLEKRWRGEGPVLDNLEWDVKTYFALGGAMHDVAVTVWGIKGWYDSARPVTAIRGMAEYGQSSDPDLPGYHPGGIPLVPGYVELINPGDLLQGPNGENIGQIKLWAWKGPFYIPDPEHDVAGVGWIRAAGWWPYQRPTFVSPPFAGYVSGHSTYSRAAAEVLTAITGDPYFPGGMGQFFCKQNQFLVFEDGPSQDLTLQWATYRDAADQCSLSRIYGGIHPPMDDMPGRFLGMEIGPEALEFAEQYFHKDPLPTDVAVFSLFPNPTLSCIQIEYPYEGALPVSIFMMDGRQVASLELNFADNRAFLDLSNLHSGVYFIVSEDANGQRRFSRKVIRL
ncbi:MAG: T9SS type A sorting domain-containing protein [Lewinella sp.]|nr:T9SS type A sorting domain-containing protein [Lewinella sp.]